MDFLVRVVRYLFWLLVVSWSVWLLKRVLGWMVRSAMGPAQQAAPFERDGSGTNTAGASGGADGLAARKLVRDPVCGLYLAEVLAIPLRQGGELMHFCSAACRDRYAAQVQRMAANG